MSCLFNSYDPYFKQPFGALRAGQTVRLTLCIPEELGYVDPHLVLQKEGKYDVPVHYRMKFDGQTPQQNHFSVELPLNDPGLYFYYFDLYTDFRRIYRGPDNCGVVSWQEGEKWQITVYDAGFQTPECIKGKVFYQIFPDRFCEGIENKPMPFPDRLYQADKHAEPFWQPNETGGHLNEDYFGGDLEGIRIKLPYLREMGVDYLYLNPIFAPTRNSRCSAARLPSTALASCWTVCSATPVPTAAISTAKAAMVTAALTATPTPPTAAGTILTPSIRAATAAGGASRPCPR